ncbi:hypothetical protein, partial [Paracoccus benzoatiresistens]
MRITFGLADLDPSDRCAHQVIDFLHPDHRRYFMGFVPSAETNRPDPDNPRFESASPQAAFHQVGMSFDQAGNDHRLAKPV